MPIHRYWPLLRDVLITRPQPAADELALLLRAEGHTVHIHPLLCIQALTPVMPTNLPRDVIVTSQNAVGWCAQVLQPNAHRFYVVGERTATMLHAVGHTDIMQVAGNASTLLAQFAGNPAQPLLYPCGQYVSVDIAGILGQQGFHVNALPVYVAKELPVDSEMWQEIWAHTGLMVPLFSGRTAQLLKKTVLQSGSISACSRQDVLCLSPHIADAVRDLPWRNLWVAQAPDLACMLTRLRQGVITDTEMT